MSRIGAGRQLIGSFGTLLAIQAVTSMVAIGLLGRMSPAIERIIEENVMSVAAAEQMLAVLAEGDSPAEPGLRSYLGALRTIEANLTEPEERAPARELRALAPETLAGEPAARQRSVALLREVGRINRGAMVRADERAKQLGIAGAWAAAFLGFAGLGASLLSMGRARRRILAPVTELARVAAAHHAGETHRRCLAPAAAAPELARVMETMNELLDVRERTVCGPPRAAPVERRALLRLLDARDEPTAVVDADGQLVATNRAADDRLAGPDGERLRDALRRAAAGEPPAEVTRMEHLGDTGASMCVLASDR